MRGISFTAFVRTVERRRWRFLPAAAAAVLAVAVGPGAAFANVPLTRLSIDTFTNSSSQHHTEVEPELERHGVGSQLVAATLDDLRARGLPVVPICPFVRGFIRRHPEYADLVETR
jgi:predicted GNAT family acetyltransferase